MRTSRLTGFVAIIAATAMALTGCTLVQAVTGGGSGGNETVTSHTDEQVDPDLEQFYKQDIAWKGCGSGMQCAELKAPVDWNDPTGAQITLAIDRHKASGTSKGSLLINPGGPGGSGYDFADGFDPSPGVYSNYDIIGWDPRGVGRSTPIVCFTDNADRDEMLYGTYSDPYGSEGWESELKARQTKWVEACKKNTGDLLAHIDTVSVAHDMDMMRAVLGDKKLNYLGYSFGTYIGTVYAELFPDKVGRMVLDGAVEPPFGTFDELATQMAGFDSAFAAYMKDCLKNDCPFHGPLQSALAEAHQLALSVDGENLKSSDGRVLDSATVGTGIALTLYNQGNWFYLTQAFQNLMDGDADLMFSLADSYNGRDSGGGYSDRSLDVYFAVTCAEGTIGTDDVDLQQGLGIMDEKAPIVGEILALDDYVLLEEACSQWPYPRPADFPTEFDAQGAPPILVIGTTNDPATPYAQSVALSKELSSGVLVTYHGEGHTVYGNGVSCIDDTVDDYFVKDVVPKSDPDC